MNEIRRVARGDVGTTSSGLSVLDIDRPIRSTPVLVNRRQKSTMISQNTRLHREIENGDGEETDLQKRTMTTLEFPEIEKTGGINSEEDSVFSPLPDIRPRATGKARSRFTAVATKILTQVVVSRQNGIEEDSTVRLNAGIRPKARTPTRTCSDSEALATSSPSPERFSRSLSYQNPRRNYCSFASVVRLASFRYHHMRAPSRLGSNSPSRSRNSTPRVKPEEAIDEPTVLPVKPRFCATLSPEAQYAMLKGYEDILREKLRSGHNEAEVGLLRAKTPLKKVICLHLSEAELPIVDTAMSVSVETGMTSPTQRATNRAATMSRSPEVERRIDTRVAPEQPSPRFARLVSLPGPKLQPIKTIPKKKQLRLSYRFERAMDLIDGLKAAPRPMLTNSTPIASTLDPVEDYNTWSRSWVREFKLEYPNN